VLRLSWTKTICLAPGKYIEHLRVIGGGVSIGDLDLAPALQRREHHEQIGHAVALVFVIVPDRLSRLGGDRRARLDDQLLRRFIQTHEGTIGIMRLLVGFQHVFHGGHEAGVGVRRDHPLPFAVGFEGVFFKVRPIVLSLAFSTMFNSTTFSSSRRRLGRTPREPASRSEQSVSPPPPRRKSAAGRSSDCIYNGQPEELTGLDGRRQPSMGGTSRIGSASPRTLPRRVAAEGDRYC
jgi:hypothetical protein